MSHSPTICAGSNASHNRVSLDRSVSLFSLIALWRSRRQLASLDATQLADVGITANDASREAARAPWNVPAHWLK